MADIAKGEATLRAEAAAQQGPAPDNEMLQQRYDTLLDEHAKLARAFDAVCVVYAGKPSPVTVEVEAIMAFKAVTRDLIGMVRDLLSAKDAPK